MKFDNKTGDILLSILNSVHEKNYKGRFGYAISYNRRKIQEELKEYSDIKSKTIMKYGHQEKGGGYSIDASDKESVANFFDELKEYMDIEHDVNIMKVPVEEVWDVLGSVDIENLQFMLLDPEE